jgi:Na+:H+ antiporter, NhaA family
MKRFLPFIVIAAVIIGAVLVTWMLVRSSRQTNSNTNQRASAAEPTGAVPPHIRGNPDASVTLEEFADFQCPSCGIYYAEIKKIEEEFGTRLRVIFREYPLYPNHEHSVLAAQAAEAAGMQGRFWDMHDKLYENQKAWSDAKDALPFFVDYARQIGLDMDRFNRDLNSDAVAGRITKDGIRGHALGVTGTPTFFVNGQEAQGDHYSPEGLRAMIHKALSGAAGP